MDRIDEMVRALSVSRRRRRAIERELRAHLDASRRDLELAGHPPEDATREALSRLGDVAEIADGFQRVYRRPALKLRVAIAFTLAGALMLLGIYGGPLASATSAHHPAHHARVVGR